MLLGCVCALKSSANLMAPALLAMARATLFSVLFSLPPFPSLASGIQRASLYPDPLSLTRWTSRKGELFLSMSEAEVTLSARGGI